MLLSQPKFQFLQFQNSKEKVAQIEQFCCQISASTFSLKLPAHPTVEV